MRRIFGIGFVSLLAWQLSACGKESAPVYRDKGGETVPTYSYPPPYGEQESNAPSGLEVDVSGQTQIEISG